MKRQQSNTTTRVYSYGTVPSHAAPVIGEERALEQMRLGNRLWNVLVAIERAARARYRRIMHDEVQERIDSLRQEADAIRAEIKARRQQARSKKIDVTDITRQLAAVKQQQARLIEHQKSTQKERHDARASELAVLHAATNRRIKRARQAAASLGLYWGTYNDVVQRADAGRKLGELQFKRFRGAGTITAQIIAGAGTEECVSGSHTFFRIDPPADGRKWRYAHIRTGSSGKDPIWLSVPIVYHRDIPTEARIKTVSATRRIVADKVRWQINVTASIPPANPRAIGPAIAIDIGWRVMTAGVRVAYWHDEAGTHGEVLVRSADISQFGKVGSLRSMCDRTRDEFLPDLASWLSRRDLPVAWVDMASQLSQWRSNDRLARLIAWWTQNRLDNDAEIYDAAVQWRRQYLHLANWRRNLQEQLTLRVREQYRIFASQIASKYSVLVVEEFDLRKVAKQPETESQEHPIGSNYRQIASPSAFRGALLNACRREGMRIITVPGAYTTRKCHVCQAVTEWDQVADIIHRCDLCGTVWDQDHNAAINLLASGLAALPKDQQDSAVIPGALI